MSAKAHTVKEIDSYLVRIVRRDADTLAGVVEQVRSGRTAPFATLAELNDLLGGRRHFARLRSPMSGAGDTLNAESKVSKP